MKRLIIVLLILLSTGSHAASAYVVRPTAEQKIRDIELTWLRAEKADPHAYSQETGVVVWPATGEIAFALVNLPDSPFLTTSPGPDTDMSQYTLSDVGIVFLHPLLVRSRGTSGAWQWYGPGGLGSCDIFTAVILSDVKFIEQVYIGRDGHFWRERLERQVYDGWDQMSQSPGGFDNYIAYAHKHPEYVTYTLARID